MNLKHLARRAFSTVLLSMLCVVAFAQTATGVVKDKAGEPMIGVNVLVKGTTNGTITDFDGNFTISDVPSNATLVVSYIGYLTKEVKAGQNLIVVLEEDNKTLDEVVVIGYGTVKRRDLTGAVASVTGEKLAANPVANVAQALQGQLPGVSVVAQDGRPGAGMSIRVRGGGSITQSNDPLYIVDGVQVSSIDDIPADNIESIDVLKDAASTAIYGARGANGVILVTTKGGSDGKVSVKYNAYYQIKTNPEILETMDAYDYVYNTWAYMTALGTSYGEGVAKYFGLGSANGNKLESYKGLKSHNYINDLMQTAGTWNHDVSLSGGNDKTKFYASLNYLDDDGIRVKSGFQRWNANFKLTQKINKSLTADFDLRYSEMEYSGSGYGNATSAYQYRPVDNPLGDPNFTAGFGQGDVNIEDTSNPLYYLDTVDYVRNNYRLRAKAGLTWKIIEGLTAKTELSLNRNWSETKNWNAGQTETDKSSAKLNKGDGYGVRWATTLNYEVQGLGEDNSLSFLVGNEVLGSKSNSSEIYGVGYPEGFTMDDAFGMINMTTPSLGQDYFKSTIGTPNRTLSWFGRANYSYKGKYLLTATFRADGSSKFAANHSWGYFPAAAAAWRISDEAFMEDASEWLDNLKLRVSYGTSGSDNISASLWKETWGTKQITVDGEKVTTYVPGDMKGNPDLKWETTISRNAGLDFGFFNNRIRGSIDFYWNTTKDILMKVPVDAASGYSYQFQNVGKTSNKGIEFALGTDLVRSEDFNLSLNLTYNYNKNNIDELMDGVMADTRAMNDWGSSMAVPAYDYIIREGHPVGLIQGFKSLGYYTIDDFTYANGIYTLKPGVPDISGVVNYPESVLKSLAAEGQTAVPGMPKFEDTDLDGTITVDDKTIIGEAMPKHTGGFTFNGNWKAIDFSLGFTYAIGGKVYNANSMHSMMGNKDNSAGQNRLAFIADTWKYYDVDASGDLILVTDPSAMAKLNENTKYASTFAEYGIVSSEFIEDASYLRLNTLTVGYTFPKNWVNKVGIQNARVYFTGTNLFCIDGYSGIDPDVNTKIDGKDGFPTPYFDYQSYPKARTYTFGVNLAF
ncbi:MAG: TonB-dependent receptor [Bacteroidaceae bacterium]|nr:TonB-dependent receptor [Bacteroidaceae bacterium]